MNGPNRSARRRTFAAFVAGVAAHSAYDRLSTRFGASQAEAVMSLPGDELVPHPMVEWTRAVTIDAPPEKIWPWLAQMGYGRGGFYIPAWIDRLVWRIPSDNAQALRPSHQHVAEGDVLADAPQYRAYWRVEHVEPGRAIVYSSIRHPWRGQAIDARDTIALAHRERQLRAGGYYLDFSWAFALREVAPGYTRLLVRTRAMYSPRWLRALPLGLVDVYLGMAVLRHIKRHVEADMQPSHHRMPVDFFEEVPTPENLAPAALITWPSTVFLVAPDAESFATVRQQLERVNPRLRAGWAVALPQSLMLSRFADAAELAHVEAELDKVPSDVPVMLDFELPYWDPGRLASPRQWRTTGEAVDSLVAATASNHELWTAEWPPPIIDWPRGLRLRAPTAQVRGYMLYSTMVPSRLRTLYCWRLRRRFAHDPGYVGVGTLAPGPGESTPSLTPAALARDLDEAADMGAAGVCLYRLAGLTPAHAAVLADRAPERSGPDDLLRQTGR